MLLRFKCQIFCLALTFQFLLSLQLQITLLFAFLVDDRVTTGASATAPAT